MLASALLYRPWFEDILLGLLTRTWWPLARVAATAGATGFDVAALRDALPHLGGGKFLRDAVDGLRERTEAYDEAEEAWRAVAFGDGDPLVASALEIARRAAAFRVLQAPGLFFPARGARGTAPIRWEIPDPATPEPAISGDGVGPIRASVPVVRKGVRSTWWRYASPMGDEGWARVREPAAGRVRATLVSLHGWAVENEMLPEGGIDPYAFLVKRGVRIVQPEAPWHGRRRLPGWGGGEPMMGRAPYAMGRLMAAWTAETAMLTRATRADGPVVWAGISLGALTAQRGASHVADDARPDGLYLVTTSGDLVVGALRGPLGRGLGTDKALARAGWTSERLAALAPSIEPAAEAPIDPRRIVMVLGDADTVTPFDGALDLARRWNLPAGNMFVSRRGHITLSLAIKDDGPALAALVRLLRID